MKPLLLMIAFFTRIPVGRRVIYSEPLYMRGVALFPIVGIVTGIPLSAAVWVCGQLGANPMLRSLVVTLAYVGMTGALHIDGLADTADGLYSGRSRERVLEIMKDSRIGTFGVVAIVTLLASLLILGSLVSDPLLWLVFPAVGKSVAMLFAGISDCARQDGMGRLFIDRASPRIAAWYLLSIGAVSYAAASVGGLIAAGGAVAAGYAVHRKVLGAIGGQTGDTIGATIEIAQIAYLLLIAADL